MAIKSVDLVGVAEGIRSHELSARAEIESLNGTLRSLEAKEASLRSSIIGLEAEIAEAYEDTDDDGYPDYGRISVLEARLYVEEDRLYETAGEIRLRNRELDEKNRELEAVEEEKARTLFEIQERARQTSDNIGFSAAIREDYSASRRALQSSMNRSLAALSRAAGILGGSIPAAMAALGPAGTTGGTPSGAVAVMSGESSGEGQPVSAERFTAGRKGLSTPGTAGHFQLSEQSQSTKPQQGFSTMQSTSDYSAAVLGAGESEWQALMSADSFSSSQTPGALDALMQPERSPAVRESSPRESLSGIGSRAKSIFAQMLGTGNRENSSPVSQILLTNSELSQIVHQILEPVRSSGNTLRDRFSRLKNIKVKELTAENKRELIRIAVANLREKYGRYLPPERLDKLERSITYITAEEMKAELGSGYSPYIMGYYMPWNDCIRINLDGNSTVGDILTTIDHEGVHFIAADTATHITGVKNRNIKKGNVGMNEGITEMYSIRNVQSIYPEYQSYSYVGQVKMMERFEKACGAEMLKRAYMGRNVTEIREDFNRCMGNSEKCRKAREKLGCRDSFDMLCTLMDEYHHYSQSGTQTAKKKAEEFSGKVHILLDAYLESKATGRPAGDYFWDRLGLSAVMKTSGGADGRRAEVRVSGPGGRRKTFADRLRTGGTLAEQAAFAGSQTDKESKN